jgi:hypothetical protein
MMSAGAAKENLFDSVNRRILKPREFYEGFDGNLARDTPPHSRSQSGSKSRKETVWRATDENQKLCDESRRKAPANQYRRKVNPENIRPEFRLVAHRNPGGRQIIAGRRNDAKIHFPPLRNSALACSQSKTCSSPRATRSAVSRKASACQTGDSNSASSRLKSAHKDSMSFNFSDRGICWISSALMA